MEPIYKQFKTTIRRLGNSKGAIIPKIIAEDWGLEEGQEVVFAIVRTSGYKSAKLKDGAQKQSNNGPV
ncbi:hypothetical protein D6789_04295, partial [Candidatus Woesearchaeota archaeon]